MMCLRILLFALLGLLLPMAAAAQTPAAARSLGTLASTLATT